MRRMCCAILALMLCLEVFAGCAKKEEGPEKNWPSYAYKDLEPNENLTKENYKMLSKGMKKAEVNLILGRGTRTYLYEFNGHSVEYYQWAGTNGEWLKIVFDDGIVVRLEPYLLTDDGEAEPKVSEEASIEPSPSLKPWEQPREILLPQALRFSEEALTYGMKKHQIIKLIGRAPDKITTINIEKNEQDLLYQNMEIEGKKDFYICFSFAPSKTDKAAGLVRISYYWHQDEAACKELLEQQILPQIEEIHGEMQVVTDSGNNSLWARRSIGEGSKIYMEICRSTDKCTAKIEFSS